MDKGKWLALALDPSLMLEAQGMAADPWQKELLFSGNKRILICCSRGAGKSRTTSVKALHTALFKPKSLTLLVSRAQRQARELFRYVKQAFRAIGSPIATVKENEGEVEFANGSRIVAVPGTEATIRCFQGVNLLIIDEAAKVPDELYATTSPMTAVSEGTQILLSTPFGQRGFFYKEWHDQEGPWQRFEVPWTKCPRIKPHFIEEERRKFGDVWVAQEYNCSFTTVEGAVYPTFHDCKELCIYLPREGDKKVGGIDWGFRNPFCALEAILTKDDVLHVNKEYYLRETLLHDIVQRLPKGYLWYADPSGRTEIEELRSANHKVLGANNDIRLGIQAVTARIRTGRLKVAQNCVNLLAESRLYRYPNEQERSVLGEKPIDEWNHAMDALRYLVAGVDKRFIAKLRKQQKVDVDPVAELDSRETIASVYKAKVQDIFDNPEVWTDLG